MAGDRMPSGPTICRLPADARTWITQQAGRGRAVAFVPTMGALHEGHLQLVRRGRQSADCVVVSIFVNPTQFGPTEDFSRYPRTWDDDLRKLADEGVSMVFAPAADDLYGDRFSTYVDPPAVARRWEGEFRPEHFRGVCTVVLKLFQIVPADVAVFGRKDYQQARVISDMVRDLNVNIAIRVEPTVREPDGLALSSRNRYLSDEERRRALSLWDALQTARRLVEDGERNGEAIEDQMRSRLVDGGVDRIDYVAFADPETLEPIPRLDAGAPHCPQHAVALIAVHVGRTRLIDNELIPLASGL